MQFDDDRTRYGRLKILTTLGPTVFVAVAEIIRFYYLRRILPPASVSLVAIAVTLVGAAGFSSYVFGVVEKMETERRAYKDAVLALQERERLAREMHDGLAQNLAAINLKVHRAKGLLESRQLDLLAEELVSVQATVNLSYAEVRQSLYDLKVGQRLQEGFWSALKKQAQDFQKTTGILVQVDPLPDNQEPWTDIAAVQILRIIQESLANVRKHSGARQVLISARWQDSTVHLTVSDDGKGFRQDEHEDLSRHFGLSIMQERAESVGGEVHIKSEIGRGTHVTIVVPLDGKGGEHSGKGKTNIGG